MMDIDYSILSKLNQAVKMQFDMLEFMDKLIAYDTEYVLKHPEDKLPDLENMGVLKSHFMTQKKACQGLLSLSARHLPRLKIEHDEIEAKKRAVRKVSPKPQPERKVTAVSSPVKPTQIPITNPQEHNPQYLSLF